MFAGIIVNNESILLDKIFTYKVPEKLLKDIKIGQLVKIPFGKSNKLVFGFVYTLKDTITTEVKNIKEVYSISEKDQLFTLSDIKLIEYIKKKLFIHLSRSYKVIYSSRYNNWS